MVANMKSIGKGIAEIKESKFVDFNKKFETVYELLEAIHNTRAGIFEAEISSDNLFTYVKSIIESNQEFSFIRQVHQMNLDISDKIILLELIWNRIIGKENIKVLEILSGVFDTAIKCFIYSQTILEKENQLVNQKFVEITTSHYINEIEITLSETSLILLKEEGIKQFANDKKKE